LLYESGTRNTAKALFLNPGNMSGGKLPTTVALDQCVRELHDSVEWFAVRCSFHARFSENNCRVIAVKPRLHVVVFKYVVMDFPAAQLVDLVRTRAHFAIRERQRKIRREHTLQRGQRLRQETLCTRRARTGARPFSSVVCASENWQAKKAAKTTSVAVFISY